MSHCTTNKCPQILDSSCVFYEGTSLIFSGINTNDSVETVIQKLNLKLESIPVFNSNNYYNKVEINNIIKGYIPLSGTLVNYPVIGNIEFSPGANTKLYSNDSYVMIDDGYVSVNGNYITISSINNNNIVLINNNQVFLDSGNSNNRKFINLSQELNYIPLQSNISGAGLVGLQYYGNNYVDNSFVQKKFVIDTFNNIDLSNYYTKPESDDRFKPINYVPDENDVTITVGTSFASVDQYQRQFNQAVADWRDNVQLQIDDLDSGKADVNHTHTIGQITHLQTTLDGKANLSHTHTISQVTNLQNALDDKLNIPLSIDGHYAVWSNSIGNYTSGFLSQNATGVGIDTSNPTEKLEVNGNVKANSYKFTLQSNITPTPNTLVPKTDGSRPMWYNNSSVANDLAFNKDLTNIVDGTTPPLMARSAYTLISGLDSNGWAKQMAWVSHDDKRLHVADIETGQSHATLDDRDLKTFGVSDALIQFTRGIYEGTHIINTGVFVSMQVFVNYSSNPRQITLKFTINSESNVPTAKGYKLKINNTTSAAQVNLNFATAGTEGTTVLVFIFNDTALMEHTTGVQEFEIYKDGVDESGVPSVNWVNEYKQDKLSTITGNVGIGKDDASATEKLDVAGRVKSDGLVLNDTISAILPKEIKFKDGKFKAALADGVEKAVLLEGDISGGGNLINYLHSSNAEIYISAINYTTGYITTSTPHGLTVGVRYRGFVMPNAFKNKDFANYKRDWQSVPIEFLNGAEYIEAIDANTVVLKNYLFNIITVNTSDASNVALNFNYWHFEIMGTSRIEFPVNNNSIKDFTLEYEGFLSCPTFTFMLNTNSGIVNNINYADTALGIFGAIVPHVVSGGFPRLSGASFKFSIDKNISSLQATGWTTTRNNGASSYSVTALNQFAGGSFTKYLIFSDNIGLAKLVIEYAYLRIANGTTIKLR